jgi:hypothetical protein
VELVDGKATELAYLLLKQKQVRTSACDHGKHALCHLSPHIRTALEAME